MERITNYQTFCKSFEFNIVKKAFENNYGLKDFFANCKQESDKRIAIRTLAEQSGLRVNFIDDNWGYISLFAEDYPI